MEIREKNPDIEFLRYEHRKILEGLHAEISKLQQKCAGLQFSLATQSLQRDEKLRVELEFLRDQNEYQRQRINELETLVSERSKTIDSMKESERWKETEHENQLSCKDIKIRELQKHLVAYSRMADLRRSSSSSSTSSSSNTHYRGGCCFRELDDESSIDYTPINNVLREEPVITLKELDRKKQQRPQFRIKGHKRRNDSDPKALMLPPIERQRPLSLKTKRSLVEITTPALKNSAKFSLAENQKSA